MNQLLPTVSVIIPAYNASLTIKQAIQSVVNQKEIEVEIIVVDDASTDQTLEQLKSVDSYSILKIFEQEKNKGPSAARNLALQKASKDWLAVLDSDDWFENERLSVLVNLAIIHDLDVIADDQRLIEGSNSSHTKLRSDSLKLLSWAVDPLRIDMDLLLNNIGLGIVQPVIRRDFLVRHQICYRDEKWYGEDFRLLYDLLRCGARMAVIGKPLYNARIHSSSLTADRVKMFSGMKQVLQDIEQELLKFRRDDWLQSVRKAVAQAEETIAYGSVMDPLKKGQILKAMNALLSNPYFPGQFAKRMLKKLLS